DRRSLALLKMATAVRPGMIHEAGPWLAAAEETNRLADESGDLHLRVALRGGSAYAYLCAGDFEGFEGELDMVLAMTAGDRTVGAGIVIASPVAWATMGKGLALRERGRIDEAEKLFDTALRIATEDGDPETASWTRSNLALMLAMRGETEAAVALGRRNCELTERLGDVFSRSLALANLAASHLAAEEYTEALEAIEEAEQVYRGAMDNGGEMEAWRAAIRAEALIGVGRVEEAVDLARWASEIARERGMLWSLPLALQALARALAEAGHEGAGEAIDEAAEVAARTGALLSLEAIEEARGEIGAGAR
ncbi:MAG TPA: tetratricopeptide repeat protein, partial [Solirubrobacterales bacterium]|nr:tetratricopeptide repeat protein [Solirubrobacterales bacterium]